MAWRGLAVFAIPSRPRWPPVDNRPGASYMTPGLT